MPALVFLASSPSDCPVVEGHNPINNHHRMCSLHLPDFFFGGVSDCEMLKSLQTKTQSFAAWLKRSSFRQPVGPFQVK